MELQKTVIADGVVELVYADNPDLTQAKTLLHIRMPVDCDPSATLAYHHLAALHAARDALSPEIQAAKHIVDLTG